MSQLSEVDFQRLQVIIFQKSVENIFLKMSQIEPSFIECFHDIIFQETLLELKTRNYTLEDQSRKQRSALGEAQAKVTVLTEELEKAKKTIDKSKKITEIQKVLSENENLKQKLLAQEDDFRLQNQTLLDELSKVSFINFYSTYYKLFLTHFISSSCIVVY